MFLTRLLILGIFFSSVLRAAVVDKPVTVGILPSISVFLALKSVFLTIPQVSGLFCQHHHFFF